MRPQDFLEHRVDDNVDFCDSDTVLDVDRLESLELFLSRQLFGFCMIQTFNECEKKIEEVRRRCKDIP